MIPVIFDSNEKVFTSNGLGRLTDCISCIVTEERNGIYECEFTYPITGVNYDLIQEGNIIVTSHDEQKDRQPFVIYRITRPISGVVTVNAHHISYELANVIISPFTASSVASAFSEIENHSVTNNPFTFWTDKTSAGSIDIKVPTSCKSILGGMKGSILDSFGGGEYEFDNYTVKLYANRGSDNGVTIRYGKNLADVVAERDVLGIYNAVIPYWSDGENTVVYGGIVVGNGGIHKSAIWTDESNIPIADENNTAIDFSYYIQQVSVMDLSAEFDNQPTVSELETRALSILNSNQPWIPKDNIKVDFVALWQTEEYANIAPLERVRLCDTVSIYYPELGVDATSKVIKVVWNVLLERYDSIELGEAKTSFAEVITAETDEKLEDVPNISMMEEAISNATSLITGGLGGHICFLYDANGKPTDMLVMDTDNVSTAVHVLRINVNGIGFSSTGVSGTYTSAWTLNGAFVADFITAGHLSANRIQGGTLTLGGNNNGNGVLSVRDASNTEIGRWDKEGIVVNSGTISGNVIKAGKIQSADGYVYFDLTNSELVCDKIRGTRTLYNKNLYIEMRAATHQDSLYADGVTFYSTGHEDSGFKFRPSSNSNLNNYLSQNVLVVGGMPGTAYTRDLKIRVPMLYASSNSIIDDTTFTFFATQEGAIDSNNHRSGAGGMQCKGSKISLIAADNGSNGWMTLSSYEISMTVGINRSVSVNGNFSANGTKSRKVETDEYGNRLLYCYETASPMFADIGEGTISEDGLCYVFIESIFAKSITTTQYQVFLQKYGEGDCYISERKEQYFVVSGTPGLAFGWELKAKQKDFEQLRTETDMDIGIPVMEDYGEAAKAYIENIKERRTSV